MATPHGAEVAGVGGSVQDYARSAADSFGGDPVVLSITMPRSIYEKGGVDLTEKRFEPGSGLEEVQQNWGSFEKHITPIPKEYPKVAK